MGTPITPLHFLNKNPLVFTLTGNLELSNVDAATADTSDVMFMSDNPELLRTVFVKESDWHAEHSVTLSSSE